MTDFAALIHALADAGVDFILVGGVAATVHGSARLTRDIDVVYARTSQNIQRVVDALSPHAPYLRGAPPGLPFSWEPATIERGLNFTLSTTLGDIDLLGEVTGGGGFDQLLPRSRRVTIFDREVLCLDLPALIQIKRAAGRPRDLEAVAELEVIAEERARRRVSTGD
jgi:predicted nucleotidyltransferase